MVTRFWDPQILFDMDGRTIRLNLSHRFPNYYTRWPNYDRAIPRLCESIFKYFNRLCVIDVGANVGDTVNLIDAKVRRLRLCVEPSERFFPLLVQKYPSVWTNYGGKKCIGRNHDASFPYDS